jgi:PPK2 family polyphosphate:nucleotide phosphotransferase
MAIDPIKRLARRYRVTNSRFRMKDVDPNDSMGLDLKDQAGDLLAEGVKQLAALQERQYAQDRWAVLLVFQALDAAGKDSTIKHVMSGINPQGCQVSSFKQPSTKELDHDFLWRVMDSLPERGRIGIFNRSYYEETLVVRVHPELLARQHLPEKLVTRSIWKDRFRHIRNFESYLTAQGTVIRKFFLHVSKKEQKKRFLERLAEPEKHWKFSAADVHERAHYDDYIECYEDAIRHTATPEAPWFVVPADRKWFTRLVVAAVVVDALRSISPSFPKVDGEQRRQLLLAKAALEAEPNGNGGEDGKRNTKKDGKRTAPKNRKKQS